MDFFVKVEQYAPQNAKRQRSQVLNAAAWLQAWSCRGKLSPDSGKLIGGLVFLFLPILPDFFLLL